MPFSQLTLQVYIFQWPMQFPLKYVTSFCVHVMIKFIINIKTAFVISLVQNLRLPYCTYRSLGNSNQNEIQVSGLWQLKRVFFKITMTHNDNDEPIFEPCDTLSISTGRGVFLIYIYRTCMKLKKQSE